MAVSYILELGVINNDTEIYICDRESNVLARGNWYQDAIQDFSDREVESFTWQDDNKAYIDVK